MAVTDQTPPQITGVPGARALGAIAGAAPLSLRFEANWKLRLVLLRVLGAAMILSSTGLWLVPGAGADPEMNLIRIGVSVAFLLVGLILMTAHEPGSQPEACFDPVRQELRILKLDKRGQPRTVLRRRYDSIGGARLTENSALFYEHDGNVLVEVPLGSAVARSQLRDQLSGAVQLFS